MSICNENEFNWDSWENQEKEALEQEVYRLRKEREQLSVKKAIPEKYPKQCEICGKAFKKPYEFVSHWLDLHQISFGEYSDFKKRYPKYIKKLLSRVNKETEERMRKDFEAEMFQLSLRTKNLPQRNDLGKMGILIATNIYEELCHEWDVQQRCSICKQSVPFVRKINDSTGEIEESDNSVREHINTMIRKGDKPHLELAKHFNNMKALSEGQNPYKEEKSEESLSKDVNSSTLAESITQKAQREQLSEPKNLPDKNLLVIFAPELVETLSKKKKKQIGRKTR